MAVADLAGGAVIATSDVLDVRRFSLERNESNIDFYGYRKSSISLVLE